MGSNQFFSDFFKFLKNRYILWFLSSWIGSGASRMAPWTPWIDIKFQKKSLKIRFLDYFSISDPWPAIIDHLDL